MEMAVFHYEDGDGTLQRYAVNPEHVSRVEEDGGRAYLVMSDGSRYPTGLTFGQAVDDLTGGSTAAARLDGAGVRGQ